MMIETNIPGLYIAIHSLEERQIAVKDFFVGSYSPEKPNQNLSHAADILALGQHTSKPIGIDIEIAPAPTDYMRVANTFFWPNELAFLNSLDNETQSNFFLALWTAKEAHCKMLRSNIHDGLPGPDFTDWIKSGFPTNYQYKHDNVDAILFFKSGKIGAKHFLLSASFLR